MTDRIIDIVAREISAAVAAGCHITGYQIAKLHNIDTKKVAGALRQLLRYGLIRLHD